MLLTRLFIFWLVLLPFVVWKNGYEGPKVVYFLSGCVPLSLFWMQRMLKNLNKTSFSKADYIYFLWLLILTVSSIFGVHPFESIIGGSYRHQGVIFFLGLWLVGKTVSILEADQKKLLTKSIAISVLVEGAIVGLQYLGGSLYVGKALGTLGESNAVAGFLAIGVYFILDSLPTLFILVPLAIVILLQSRSGLVSLVPFLLKLKKKSVRVAGIIVVLAVVVFVLQKNISVFENRPLIWRLGISQVINKPLLGFGAESGEVVYDTAFIKAEMPLLGLVVDRAHNLFLDVLMWSGMLGFIVFFFWMYLSYSKIGDISKKLALYAFLIYAMFQPLSVVHWALLFIVLNSS